MHQRVKTKTVSNELANDAFPCAQAPLRLRFLEGAPVASGLVFSAPFSVPSPLEVRGTVFFLEGFPFAAAFGLPPPDFTDPSPFLEEWDFGVLDLDLAWPLFWPLLLDPFDPPPLPSNCKSLESCLHSGRMGDRWDSNKEFSYIYILHAALNLIICM